MSKTLRTFRAVRFIIFEISFLITTFSVEFTSMEEMRKKFYNTNILEGNFFNKRIDLFNCIHSRNFNSKKKKVYFADETGQKKFDEIYDEIGSLRRSSTDENINAEYSKLPGTILRLAGCLHVMENVNLSLFKIRQLKEKTPQTFQKKYLKSHLVWQNII